MENKMTKTTITVSDPAFGNCYCTITGPSFKEALVLTSKLDTIISDVDVTPRTHDSSEVLRTEFQVFVREGAPITPTETTVAHAENNTEVVSTEQVNSTPDDVEPVNMRIDREIVVNSDELIEELNAAEEQPKKRRGRKPGSKNKKNASSTLAEDVQNVQKETVEAEVATLTSVGRHNFTEEELEVEEEFLDEEESLRATLREESEPDIAPSFCEQFGVSLDVLNGVTKRRDIIKKFLELGITEFDDMVSLCEEFKAQGVRCLQPFEDVRHCLKDAYQLVISTEVPA